MKRKLLFFLFNSLLGTFLYCLFLYYMFPSEVVRQRIIYEAYQKGIRMQLESVKPSFPYGLTFYNLELYSMDDKAKRERDKKKKNNSPAQNVDSADSTTNKNPNRSPNFESAPIDSRNIDGANSTKSENDMDKEPPLSDEMRNSSDALKNISADTGPNIAEPPPSGDDDKSSRKERKKKNRKKDQENEEGALGGSESASNNSSSKKGENSAGTEEKPFLVVESFTIDSLLPIAEYAKNYKKDDKASQKLDPISFSGKLYGGDLKGTYQKDPEGQTIDLKVSSFDLSNYPIKTENNDVKMKGFLNIDTHLLLAGKTKDSQGSITIAFKNFVVTKGSKVATIDIPMDLAFEHKAEPIEVKNGRAEFEEFHLVSGPVTIDITGFLMINPEISRSRLNLKAAIRFGEDLKLLTAFLPSQAKAEDGSFHYVISGQLNRLNTRPDRLSARRSGKKDRASKIIRENDPSDSKFTPDFPPGMPMPPGMPGRPGPNGFTPSDFVPPGSMNGLSSESDPLEREKLREQRRQRAEERRRQRELLRRQREEDGGRTSTHEDSGDNLDPYDPRPRRRPSTSNADPVENDPTEDGLGFDE